MGVHSAEEAEFPTQSFDIISCGQSWLYFDTRRMIPLLKQWLKPGGKLVLAYLATGACLDDLSEFPVDQVPRAQRH
jgi:SAM-dependent methyltransferase